MPWIRDVWSNVLKNDQEITLDLEEMKEQLENLTPAEGAKVIKNYARKQFISITRGECNCELNFTRNSKTFIETTRIGEENRYYFNGIVGNEMTINKRTSYYTFHDDNPVLDTIRELREKREGFRFFIEAAPYRYESLIGEVNINNGYAVVEIHHN